MVMKQILIVTEGIADVVFFGQYIRYIHSLPIPPKPKPKSSDKQYKKEISSIKCSSEVEYKIVCTDGKDNIKSVSVKQAIEMTIDGGGDVLFIFDADNDFTQNKQSILNQWADLNVANHPEPKIFLFPNNKDAGALENLLEQIIHPCNKPLFEYWKDLKQDALISKLTDKYNSCDLCNSFLPMKLYGPDLKMAIHNYAYQLTLENAKERDRDYTDKRIWNLDCEYLEPLKSFLLDI